MSALLTIYIPMHIYTYLTGTFDCMASCIWCLFPYDYTI